MNEEKIVAENEPKPVQTPEVAQLVSIDAGELETLRKQAAERTQYLDLLQRSRAEFENYQKRNQKEREQERRYFQGR